MNRRASILLGAVVAVTLLAGCLPIPQLPEPSPSVTNESPGVVSVPSEGMTHVRRPSRVSYKHQPPSSGNHYSDSLAPRPYDVYASTPLLPEEWVHNLEHGAIVMVYRCQGSECDDMELEALDLMEQVPPDPQFGAVKFLASPYQEMDPKVAVLAWTKEQDFDHIDGAAIIKFYEKYVNTGPEKLR